MKLVSWDISARVSTWCWSGISSKGTENRDGGKLYSFYVMFFASVKSMKQLSAVRGHMHHSKGVFAVTLKSEFHLEGESVVWLHSNATIVVLNVLSHTSFPALALNTFWSSSEIISIFRRWECPNFTNAKKKNYTNCEETVHWEFEKQIALEYSLELNIYLDTKLYSFLYLSFQSSTENAKIIIQSCKLGAVYSGTFIKILACMLKKPLAMYGQ